MHMHPLTTFTFDSAKILNSTVRSAHEHSVQYRVTTQKRGSSRQTTSLEGTSGTPLATIDWKSKTFEISGSRRDMADLRIRRGTFSSSYYWSWFDCEEYKVKYSAELDHTWTVYSYSGTVLATFTSNIQRVFKDNSLPMLCISQSIRDEDERQFIILVLIYSEAKRLDSLKQRPLSAIGDLFGNAGDALGGQ
ncbi:hypothetical protein DFH07DRAFT_833504 [Mycena maculata]|uniref:DUF6593 domain-containing protein n=1 Tax=Mycena maculata TaxID=230809 RepID=A0AAD7IN08_9AGAR|nr:hypothetical protein DFH07DRAFT_833504 [Mycena maculata]